MPGNQQTKIMKEYEMGERQENDQLEVKIQMAATVEMCSLDKPQVTRKTHLNSCQCTGNQQTKPKWNDQRHSETEKTVTKRSLTKGRHHCRYPVYIYIKESSPMGAAILNFVL